MRNYLNVIMAMVVVASFAACKEAEAPVVVLDEASADVTTDTVDSAVEAAPAPVSSAMTTTATDAEPVEKTGESQKDAKVESEVAKDASSESAN